MEKLNSLVSFDTYSGSIPEPWHIICKLSFQQLLFLSQFLRAYLSRNLVPSRVLETAPRRHEEGETKGHTEESAHALAKWATDLRNNSNQETVAFNEPGPVTAKVDVGGDDASTVAAHDLSFS